MRFSRSSVLLASASAVMAAGRPADTSICDYYTTALLKNNTAENQLTLLTLVVNTAVIGNYTQPNVGISVPGILAPGKFNGEDVELLPYFNGDLKSTNRGNMAVSVNFLDGGGAAPLKMNKPANDDKSRQYFLLTHLYSFFGSLLGCTQYGMGAFPAYKGAASMGSVHKFMDLDEAELGYFIQQVALSAASFGVAEEDLMVVGKALNGLFGMRCSPPATAIKEQGPALQAICQASSCPLAPEATCAAYGNSTAPAPAMSSGMSGGGMMPNATGMPGKPSPTGIATAGAAGLGVSGFVALVAALAL